MQHLGQMNVRAKDFVNFYFVDLKAFPSISDFGTWSTKPRSETEPMAITLQI